MLCREITVGVQTRCQRKIWKHCRIIYQLHGTDSLIGRWAELSCQRTLRARSLPRSHCSVHSATLNQSRHCHYVARAVTVTGFHTALSSAEYPASWTTERPQFDFRQRQGLSILALRPAHRTPCPMDWGSTFPAVKRPDLCADLHLLPKVKNALAFPALLHTSLWRGA